MVNLPVSSRLEIAPLSASFGSVTNSYKFYWFLAILESVRASESQVIPIDALLARMIASVWYPLHYFRLSFGKQDRLGAAANKLRTSVRSLDANASQIDIREVALTHLSTKSPLSQEIRSIGNYVPQRFLRPFFQSELRGIDDWKVNAMVEKLAEAGFRSEMFPCLYRFVDLPERGIEVHPLWWEYLRRNLYIRLYRD